MSQRRWHGLGLLAIALSASAAHGCVRDVDVPPDRVSIGPAPLRRLSNVEYLDVLHDMFPTQAPKLPPLPDDIPVAGFENAAEAQTPSDLRVARYETIANAYATALTVDTAATRAFVGCDWSTPTLEQACKDKFISEMGRRAFRRPLDDGERDRFTRRFAAWESAVDFEGAVRLLTSAMLQSPQFLYRAEPALRVGAVGTPAPVEPYAMASRLSFFLWESAPDDALLDAASKNELQTEDQIRTQAERMLSDARASRVFWSFHRQWLALDRVLLDEHAVRTAEVDPSWSASTQLSAVKETELFVENTLTQGGTFRDLLTSSRAWIDSEMARVYGVPTSGDPGAFTETTLPEAERAGLLTRTSFLAGYSHRGATSPPVRGNGIQLRLLCQLPVEPPPGVDLSQPKPEAGDGPKTNRQLFEKRTQPGACQRCHIGLNGLGFPFESYDAAGHFHTTENGLPVDPSGQIVGTDVDAPVKGGVELSRALARSQTVHQCATQQWVRYALGRAPAREEQATLDALSSKFFAGKGDVRALVLGIVTSPTFRMRKVEAP